MRINNSVRVKISIHALREEGDFIMDYTSYPTKEFLSTPSARRATVPALRRCGPDADFYPRPPRGGRRGLSSKIFFCKSISIHALREEGDVFVCFLRYAY